MVPDPAGRRARPGDDRESAHLGSSPAARELADAEVAKRRATILGLVASLELVDVDAVVLDRADQPMPSELGTLGAIHLATAPLWKEMTHVDLVMATHDRALALGAHAHGLPVVGVPPL